MAYGRNSNPWMNSGYAIPKYVEAEPPQRGTFTTKWLPRGTISQVIPDYLAEPVRGRVGNTLATSSLSGSCFDGSTLAGSSLGDDTLAAIGAPTNTGVVGQIGGPNRASFTKYGQKVARELMARFKGLPNADRAKMLKKALGKIDPTLPARCEKYALEAQKAGAPAPAALEMGIARAVSEGVLTELATIGRARRSSPQARSLRGLGRSHSALGAVAVNIGQALNTPLVNLAATPPSPGECRLDANGKPAFIWIAATATVAGHWERLRTGQACATVNANGAAPDIRDHINGAAGGGIVVTDASGQVVGTTVTTAPPITDSTFMAIGPFKFPVGGGGIHWQSKLPKEWQSFVAQVVRDGKNTMGVGSSHLTQFFDNLPADGYVNNQYFGLGVTSKPTWNPVARFTHPTKGGDWGVFMSLDYKFHDKPIGDADNTATLHIITAPIQKAWYEKIWDWIKELVATIVDVVKDAVEAVKDATCGLLSQPGIDQAAVSAAASAPTPATAGAAAGVVIGQKLCGGEQPPSQLPTPPVDNGMGLLLPVAIGGGLILLYALTR